MEVIPVLDLKGGTVVHARMGRRDQYRPIETPLAAGSDPVAVARGLLSVYPFRTFYVADLDAIAGQGDNDHALSPLKAALPGVALWVDNGAAYARRAQAWLDAGLGHLVLGSESQHDAELLRRLHRDDRVILSLDYRGDAFVGPAALLQEPDAWPDRVIVMTLSRVGSGEGPEAEKLAGVRRLAPDKRVYAAGGVRGAGDLEKLAREGIAGALVASSLHNGKLTGAQIARL
ncbi:MAG: nickel transporter [Alphaproteobacteria bacterium]|nr:nickel transporter [Alphaproteobacteria bacterium]